MTTIKYMPVDNMVQSMRQIRDEMSNEIKDMTFAEERAFLDNLLQGKNSQKNKQSKKKTSVNPGL
jgi:hypothetical protein